MTNNFRRKPSTKKGYIESVEVSDLIKNDYVGYNQNDYHIHTLSIKDDRGEVKKFEMRQISTEPKLPVGTYVSFRYNKKQEFKLPVIEVKSFGKAFTQAELQAINNDIKQENSDATAEPKIEKIKNSENSSKVRKSRTSNRRV